jgi:hypothetical protein
MKSVNIGLNKSNLSLKFSAQKGPTIVKIGLNVFLGRVCLKNDQFQIKDFLYLTVSCLRTPSKIGACSSTQTNSWEYKAKLALCKANF